MIFILLKEVEYTTEPGASKNKDKRRLINVAIINYISINPESGKATIKTNDNITYYLSEENTNDMLEFLMNPKKLQPYMIEKAL